MGLAKSRRARNALYVRRRSRSDGRGQYPRRGPARAAGSSGSRASARALGGRYGTVGAVMSDGYRVDAVGLAGKVVRSGMLGS